MKHIRYPLALLVLLTLACSLVGQTATPALPTENTAAPPDTSPTRPAPPTGSVSERRCGDAVCDGPENAENCPQDCAAEGAASTAPAGNAAGQSVLNPTTGARLYVQVTMPEDADGGPYPALVIVPGGIGFGSSTDTSEHLSETLAAGGIVVVDFDPDGRGLSEGVEDYDGYAQQDGLAAVIEFAAALPQVDPQRVGLVSLSYGITMASGALARHPDLPVLFLMDWEGPADRYDTTFECAGNSHIDFAPCNDEAFWQEREAIRFIPDIQIPYQRVQSEKDHAQPDVTHAVNMIDAALQGAAPWVRLNDFPPNQVYDPDNPPQMLSESESRSLENLILRYVQEMFRLHSAP